MHLGRKFEHLIESYRRPDGSRWTGQQLDEATGGVVTRSYVTNLRKGRIESPGYEKLRAIAKAMDFPPALWFEEDAGMWIEPPGGSHGLAARVEHLFEVIRNPKTGEPYTNAEVARMSAGDLSEEDAEAIRIGREPNPPVGQVVALAAVFGVEPSYFLDRGEPAVFDRELAEALRDETVRTITRESSELSDRERRMVLGIVRQFGNQEEAPRG